MKFDVRDTRNNNWLWIRREMLREHGDDLGMRGVSVYAALASFADDDNTAYPSLGTIAEMLGISRPTVRKAIQDLNRLGWIGYKERSNDAGGDTSHLFYLLECPVENDLGGGGNSDSTGSQADCHEVERKEVNSNNSARDGVDVYREFFEYQINNIQKEQIRERVDDLDLWRAVLQWWSMNGYRNRSVGRMLNKYKQINQSSDLYRDAGGDGHSGDGVPAGVTPNGLPQVEPGRDPTDHRSLCR